MRNIILFLVWFIVSNIVISIALELISLPDYLFNAIGIALCLLLLYVSIETKCFTIKNKK